MSDLAIRIEAHALANAVKYGGKAQPGNVLPKIIGEFPDAKKDIPGLRAQIEGVLASVNALAPDAQRARLGEIGADLLEKKAAKERDLPELPNAVRGKVVTRLPPEPSKYNHLGHALTFSINSLYARRYDGRLVLRFEDANPEKVSQEYVDAMLDDIQGYLGIRVDEIRYVSDDMEILYAAARRLIAQGDAYMCSCERETVSENRRLGRECACRDRDPAQSERLWEEFVAGRYLDGQYVLRLKGDMKSKNSVMLDPVLFRAVATPHFRVGTRYKAWPLYDLYSPIEEDLCKVTHVIRSNEFDLRIELHKRLQDALGLPRQEIVHYGRFNIRDATTKGREIRELIESGQYLGWDDPRLVTLKALRRRGIRKEAYEMLAKQLGLSPYPVNLDFSMLAALNRELVEPIAHRYSFIEDPREIAIAGAPHEEVTLHLHPSRKDGGRTLRVAGRYLVRAEDHAQFGAQPIRLKDHLTFERAGEGYAFVAKEVGARKFSLNVNWLPADPSQHMRATIMMPDATLRHGLVEHGMTSARVDDIVQFERLGFCRLDAIEDGVYRFWYTHD